MKDDNLFSHPVESQFEAPTHDNASDPVENPVFSDKQSQIHQ